MTITYPLSLPSSPLPTKQKIIMDAAVALSESPFTFEQQVYQHQGRRWKLQLTYPAMRRAVAEPWIAVMAKLNARYGTFLAGDYDALTPRGSAPGSPQVSGAAQTGGSLATKGWTAGQTGILKAGDYIQLGSGSSSRLYKVLDDASSDGSGLATLNIWPNLRSSPNDGDAITTSNCVSVFRLDAPFSWDTDEVSTYGFSLTATESL